jgi:hypothetical protein
MKTTALLLFALLLALRPASASEERALVDLTTGDVLQYTTPLVPAAPNPTRWVKVTRQAQPAFDSNTQRLQKVVTVAPDKSSVAITWNVVAVPQATIDATALSFAEAVERDQKRQRGKDAVATLRQWALDAQATTVTSGTAVATLQIVVTRLGKFFDNFADLIESQP